MSNKRIVDPKTLCASMRRCVQIRISYGDTDQMRVVYHSNYLRFMERGRVEWLRSAGLSYANMERQDVGLPVVDAGLSYFAPALYDDIVTVWVGVSRVSAARLNFDYRLTVEAGDREALPKALLLVTGHTKHGCIDLQERKAARFPDDVYEALVAHGVQKGSD